MFTDPDHTPAAISNIAVLSINDSQVVHKPKLLLILHCAMKNGSQQVHLPNSLSTASITLHAIPEILTKIAFKHRAWTKFDTSLLGPGVKYFLFICENDVFRTATRHYDNICKTPKQTNQNSLLVKIVPLDQPNEWFVSPHTCNAETSFSTPARRAKR